MHIFEMPIRGQDSHGAGHFGASRANGARKHKGLDLLCESGTIIQSPINGVITKIGYPYRAKERRSIRSIDVTNNNIRYRFFYVLPMTMQHKGLKAVKVGDSINFGDVLGIAQSLDKFIPSMPTHVHFEIRTSNKVFVDPTPFYWGMKEFMNS